MRIYPPFFTYIKEPHPLSGYECVSWHDLSPCLHAHATCIITIVIFGYARSIINHRLWHRCQWFITMATYWSHCDITVNACEICFIVEHELWQKLTEITGDLHSQVNILWYYLIYWQFAPEDIMAVIEIHGAHFLTDLLLSFCIFRHF